MRIEFQPEAVRDLLNAQEWYESRATGLGHDFERAVQVAVQAALRRPLAYPEVAPGKRRILLRHFPYSLYYAVSQDVLNVLAVFHHRRRPH